MSVCMRCNAAGASRPHDTVVVNGHGQTWRDAAGVYGQLELKDRSQLAKFSLAARHSANEKPHCEVTFVLGPRIRRRKARSRDSCWRHRNKKTKP